MRLDWHTDKGDTVKQWRHDNLAAHYMVTNNQKSFYQWHIKEHLVYAFLNPVDYSVVPLSLTCSNVLYLSHKYWIFWLDKLLYRNNPIKGCGVVFPASDILLGCCIRGYDYCTVLSLMDLLFVVVFLDVSFSKLLFVVIPQQCPLQTCVGSLMHHKILFIN